MCDHLGGSGQSPHISGMNRKHLLTFNQKSKIATAQESKKVSVVELKRSITPQMTISLKHSSSDYNKKRQAISPTWHHCGIVILRLAAIPCSLASRLSHCNFRF